MTKEELAKYLADGLSLDQISARVGRHPSTVSYHLRKHGLMAVGHDVHAPNQKVDPDRLRELIEGGATVREAAVEFGAGYSTIRHWIKKLGLETKRMERLRESRQAMDAGQQEAILICPEHGAVRFVRRSDGNYRCCKCCTAAVSEWRRRVKLRLIARAGGACQICGYDRHPAALHFHHLDPESKSFLISRNGVTRSFAEAAAEADKCILLCANCHAEVEAGVTELPTNALPLKFASQPRRG